MGEWPLGVVPATGIPVTNSAIHKATSRRSAGSWNNPQGSFQLLAPFMAYESFRNCTRQNHGTAGNREAGGFVNSAVTVLKLSAQRCKEICPLAIFYFHIESSIEHV